MRTCLHRGGGSDGERDALGWWNASSILHFCCAERGVRRVSSWGVMGGRAAFAGEQSARFQRRAA